MSEGAVNVVRQLHDAGFLALWAGGCVRDMLIDRVPKDYDIVTDATPDQVMRIFPRAIAIGKIFGVVKVLMNDYGYEVATFRKDHAYSDGRRPKSVTFSDPQTDAQRRDFTINALFFDPLSGNIHDYVNGKNDIKKRVVRTVGNPNQRFEEDHLRMIRAIRFAFTLDFTLDSHTADAIRQNAGYIQKISSERIQQELTRILVESRASGDAVDQLQKVGLLKEILPEVEAMKGEQQPLQFHPEGDVFTHTVLMLNALKSPSLQLAYAVLFHDVGKPKTVGFAKGRIRFDNHANVGAAMVEQIGKRLRMSSNDINAISFCVGNHMRFMEVRNMRRSTLMRLVGAPTFPIELELHYLDCIASHGDITNYEFLLEFRKSHMQNRPVLPKSWITGHDILALGISEGPCIGKWKRKAYEAQLEGHFENREAIMEWLKKLIGSSDSL